MRVISIKRLREFWRRHADAEEPLRNWYKTVSGAEWKSLQDARATYPYADGVQTADGQTLTVFNISGNKYRLVVKVEYELKTVYIRFIGSHADYDKIDASII